MYTNFPNEVYAELVRCAKLFAGSVPDVVRWYRNINPDGVGEEIIEAQQIKMNK